MTTGRIAEGVGFGAGIAGAEYNDAPAGLGRGGVQKSVLPGSTTVTEAMAAVFPRDATVSERIADLLAREGAWTALRSGAGFRSAARKAAGNLRAKGSAAALRAAEELERLMGDGELLDRYRSSLLET